jgi:uncharacterized protein (DUF924 family)
LCYYYSCVPIALPMMPSPSEIAVDPPQTTQERWIADVHAFWFEDLQPEAWFRSDPTVDATIRERFSDLHASMMLDPIFPTTPKAAVAAVIVLDQFSRNMFRGTPAAYAADPFALRLSQAAIATEFDRRLSVAERQFLYMPFQHSEDLAVQRRSVELFGSLVMPDQLGFAEEHRAIIERFGRFPHRNAILGRQTTPDEVEFLKTVRRL